MEKYKMFQSPPISHPTPVPLSSPPSLKEHGMYLGSGIHSILCGLQLHHGF